MKAEEVNKKKDIYIHGYPSMICLIWKNKAVIGYTHTYQEADAICEKNLELLWDFNINEKMEKKQLYYQTRNFKNYLFLQFMILFKIS